MYINVYILKKELNLCYCKHTYTCVGVDSWPAATEGPTLSTMTCGAH